MQEWATLPVPPAGTWRRPINETLVHRADCGIFWLNMPTGIALPPDARARLPESHGPATRLDLRY